MSRHGSHTTQGPDAQAVPADASPSNDANQAVRRQSRRRRLHAEAAVWVLRIDAGRASLTSDSLAAWCARSPEHREAFDHAFGQWRAADALRQQTKQRMAAPPRTSELAAAARARPERHQPQAVPQRRRKPFGFPMTASCAFLLVAVVGLAAARVAFAPDYTTSTGEVRTLSLDDGSVVRLDANSAIDVRYSAGERGVTLRRGRAAFVVRHGDARPFVVAAGNGTVQDIGTAFQVAREEDGARVAVVVTAGSVLIRNAYGSAKASAGESVDYADAGRGPQSTQIDIGAATAWQRERLVFDDAPLSEVAEQLNRYYPGHYVFVREDAARIRVSGNFNIHAPGQAVDTLAETLHLNTTRIAGRIIVIDAPAAS